MNSFLDTIKNLGLPRVALLTGITVGILIFFIYLSTRLATPEMELLFDDLQQADAGAVVEQLESLNAPYQLSGDGTRILVPSDQRDRLRMLLAQQGLPNGGSVGFGDLFDDPPGLGVTNEVININRLRALQGELERTISSLDPVQRARVHLVLPERQIFTRERRDPSASVVVALQSGRELNAEQVRSIQHIVAFAIPDMAPGQVSVADTSGNLLAAPQDENSPQALATQADGMRRGREIQLMRDIENVLFPVVGVGNARVAVSAELNFDRVTTVEDVVDPEQTAPISVQTVERSDESNEFEGPEPVTVGENVPNPDPINQPGNQAFTRSSETEETTNFEVSRLQRNTVQELGRVERLSISILVDGRYTTGAEGEEVYQPRGEDELAALENLARGAVGFDASRGDTITLINLPFERDPLLLPDTEAGLIFGIPVQEVRRLAEVAILALVAILVLLLIVRPLITRLMTPAPAPAGGPDDIGLLTDQSLDVPALTGPEGLSGIEDVESQLDQMINISQVEGRVRASSLKKIGDIVEKYPEEAVSIIRNWLYEGKET